MSNFNQLLVDYELFKKTTSEQIIELQTTIKSLRIMLESNNTSNINQKSCINEPSSITKEPLINEPSSITEEPPINEPSSITEEPPINDTSSPKELSTIKNEPEIKKKYNGYTLFSKEYRIEAFQKLYDDTNEKPRQADIIKELAAMWKNADKETQLFWKNKANEINKL